MKDVTGYKSTWCFSRVKSEAELIFAPAGIFCTESKYVSALNICPFHHSELGIGWRSLYNVLRKLRALEMETFEITLSNVNLYKIVS